MLCAAGRNHRESASAPHEIELAGALARTQLDLQRFAAEFQLLSRSERHSVARRGLHERLVGVEAVVGPDGRAYRPVVKSSIDRTHQAALETALQLWRFEPARRGDGPLGARVPLEVPLRVY